MTVKCQTNLATIMHINVAIKIIYKYCTYFIHIIEPIVLLQL